MERDLFVTPSGSTAYLRFHGFEKLRHIDAQAATFTGGSSTSSNDTMTVRMLSPTLIDLSLKQQGHEGFNAVREEIAYLAAITHFEELSAQPADSGGVRTLELDGGSALELLRRPKLSDREIRRFIVRRVYQGYARSTLADLVPIDGLDFKIIGANVTDVTRNAQLLEAEGYLTIESTSATGVWIKPTARLVRDVEQYGAARADVASERDYVQAIGAYAPLSKHLSVLELEYRRYVPATTDIELESVFRAVAPVVERIAKELLAASGSTKQLSTLGPVIGELQAFAIGGPPLWTQLNHILKFGRDLSQHGSALPTMVLRIACANAFELVPQLGALFPR